MDTPEFFSLSRARVELAIPDKKPLFSSTEARAEAERCLYCVDAPCIKACPTEIDIPTFIRRIGTGDSVGSAQTIFAQNILGASCARVCPVEVLCEGACVYTGWHRDPVKIGRLQRFAIDTAALAASALPRREAVGGARKFAVIGAGPASLAFAAELVLNGHRATIFEKRPYAGGLNTSGVAPHKFHAHDSLREARWVADLGIDIRFGVALGKELRGADLLAEYDAVFIGVGLGDDTRLAVPGEEGAGVMYFQVAIASMAAKRLSTPSPKGAMRRASC